MLIFPNSSYSDLSLYQPWLPQKVGGRGSASGHRKEAGWRTALSGLGAYLKDSFVLFFFLGEVLQVLTIQLPKVLHPTGFTT